MTTTAKAALAAARNIQRDAEAILPEADQPRLDQVAPGYELLAAEVPLDRIRTDGGTQMRAALDDDTIDEYVAVMLAAGSYDPFPPVVCYYDGSTYWLADGFHRVAAARKVWIFDKKIPVLVHPGDRRDAILRAAGANAAHGLRRTNADKRRAVETLLRDEQWTRWSDQEIARRCAVDPKTVGNIRRELTGTLEIPESPTRVTADGRQMHVAPIGEKLPNASIWHLSKTVLAWFEAQPGTLVQHHETATLMAADGDSHPQYPILAAYLDDALVAGTTYNPVPHRWRKQDLIKALEDAARGLEKQIGETKFTAHQLPSGLWYARNYGNATKATPVCPSADLALAAARTGSLDADRWYRYSDIELAIDTNRDGDYHVGYVLAHALGDDLHEITLGLRRRVADWPEDAVAADRLANVEQRIADLAATVRLVAPASSAVPAAEPPRPPLSPALPAPVLAGADPALVTRRAKLLHLRELYTQALNALSGVGDLTGHFTDILPLKRSLADLLVIIETNLGIRPAPIPAQGGEEPPA